MRTTRHTHASPKVGRVGGPADRRPHGESPYSDPPLANPFDAIPLVPADVELRHDSRGLLHVRRRRSLRPLQQRIANWLGQEIFHTLELDEHGTLFFRLADGTRSLRAIADAMAIASKRTPQDVDAGVVVFTKRLMTLRLLELKLPPPGPTEPTPPESDS